MKSGVRFKVILLVSMLLFSVFQGCSKTENQRLKTENDNRNEEETTREDSSAFAIVNEMKIGWNLGNTLDSCDFKKSGMKQPISNNTAEIYYETLWNNPITTRNMIKMVADAGFGAIRIPISFYDHMDENYHIRKEWLDRVEEVVNYVVSNDLYCIINLHHEEAWLTADYEKLEQNKERLRIVWEQIAERFKSYDESLLFEGFNELVDEDKNWSNAETSSYDTVNALNQVFVDTVRNSSSYNKERYLVVNTYAASIDQDILDYFVLPKDTISNHLIVQVHCYAPLEFTWTKELVTWTTDRSLWLEEDTSFIDVILTRLNQRFVSKGIPVIIGEFGAWNKNNLAQRIKYAQYVVKEAKKYRITCFWWDCGGIYQSKEEITTSVLLNRTGLSWYYKEIVESMVKSTKE